MQFFQRETQYFQLPVYMYFQLCCIAPIAFQGGCSIVLSTLVFESVYFSKSSLYIIVRLLNFNQCDGK